MFSLDPWWQWCSWADCCGFSLSFSGHATWALLFALIRSVILSSESRLAVIHLLWVWTHLAVRIGASFRRSWLIWVLLLPWPEPWGHLGEVRSEAWWGGLPGFGEESLNEIVFCSLANVAYLPPKITLIFYLHASYIWHTLRQTYQEHTLSYNQDSSYNKDQTTVLASAHKNVFLLSLLL